jgi:predicted permease
MSLIARDLRYGWRTLWRNPAFALIAITTLALGIGANAAIFTLVHAVLLRSLPVANPNQLYSLGDNNTAGATDEIKENVTLFSYPQYTDLRAQSPEFSEIAAFQSWLETLSVRQAGSSTASTAYKGELVTGNYFSLFGIGAYAGRMFNSNDDQPNAAPVAVMSYKIWSQDFGSKPSVIGTTFVINNVPMTIVGIAPPGFFGDTLRSDPPNFWIPLSMEPSLDKDNPLLREAKVYWLYAIGRIRPGVQPMQAQTHLTTQIRQWLSAQAGNSSSDTQRIARVHMTLAPAGGGIAGLQRDYGYGLMLLMVISGLVLLIACANIANLLLARGSTARLQSAMRVALGATRGRIIRQTLTEGVLVALIGGVVGVALAFSGTRILLTLAFRGADYLPISPNPSAAVLAFTFALCLVTGIVFSVAPAWIASHAHPAELLHGAGRTTGAHSTLPQKSLVAFQAALSLVLLVGAGLLTQSLRHLGDQTFGWDRNTQVVNVNPALAGYTPERLPALYQRLQESLSRIPGISSVSYALYSPLDGRDWRAQISVAGRTPSANPEEDAAFYDRIGPRYFETIGTKLVRGRSINEHDTPASQHVAVVTEKFAKKFFPHDNPIGKHLGVGDISHSGDFEVVGVVEDAKYQSAKAAPDPMVFLPLLQTGAYKPGSPESQAQIWESYIDSIQLRTNAAPETLRPVIQRALADIDPNLTLLSTISLEERVALRFNGTRLIARLTTLYGFVALALACVGVYGVASYMVARRTSEIGIRMALGANRARVVFMVLRESMIPITIGLLVGIPVAIGSARIIASQLYAVKSYDPLILLSAISVLVVCAVLAANLPARRAASINPIRALKSE